MHLNISRGPNCNLQRINRLFHTDDNGLFYYTYSFYGLIKQSKKELNRLKRLKKDLLSKSIKINSLKKNKNNVSFDIEEENIIKLREQFNKVSKLPLKKI